MKVIVCLCALVALTLARPEEKYTDKYDNINIHEILDNDKLLDAYVKCVLDLGKCTPEGKELKSHIQEALENECGRCTDKQKQETETVIRHLINHKIEAWKQLTAKYDPNGKFSKKYEDRLRTVKAN